jgi:hypothetical protein
MIAIYPAINSSGSADKDFTSTWDELVRATFMTGAAPVPSRVNRAEGYEALIGSSSGKSQGKETVVLLVNFTGDGKTISIIINYSDVKYQSVTNDFLKSIAFKPLASGSIVPSNQATFTDKPSQAVPPVNTDKEGGIASKIGSIGISGVWMGMIWSVNGPEMKCITIFTNGEIRELMPRGGYRYLDPAADKKNYPNNWGSYVKNGQTYTVIKPSASLYKGKIIPVSDKKLEFDGDVYQRIPTFDGFRLNGSYTTLADPDQTAVTDGHEPVITFSDNGRFIDKGIRYILDIGGNTSDQKGGSGTYEIKSFTISLHYDDGRVINYSITGFLTSPAITDSSIVICNARLNKKSR